LLSYCCRFMETADTISVSERPQPELARVWQSLPNKALFFGPLVFWLALFHFLGSSTWGYVKSDSLYRWFYFVTTTSADDGHCLYMPLVVLGLFWWKRKQLIEIPKAEWWPGLVWLGCGLLLHVIGYMVQQNRISIIGFFVGMYGLMGLAWGPAWLRATVFPFFLLIFCVPLGTMAETLTFPLRLMVTTISGWIGREILGINVIRIGTQLFDPQRPDFQFDVAAACSGLRSLTVLAALTTIYAFVSFRLWWKRGLMLLFAVPLAVVGNVFRITGVLVTAEAFGQKAGHVFHDMAGFLIFILAIAGVMGFGMALKEDK